MVQSGMSGEGQITQLCSIPEGEPVEQSQSLHTVWYNLDHLILRSVYLLWRKIQSALLSNPRLVHWVVDVITMVNRCAPTKSISSTILCAFCPVSPRRIPSGISKFLSSLDYGVSVPHDCHVPVFTHCSKKLLPGSYPRLFSHFCV